jgi:peptidoglycan/xylan/chitin deacetylase (PgdA/CDA1 family)
VLKKYDAQALFYISTATLNTNDEFWWDALERILLNNTLKPSTDSFQISGNEYLLSSDSDDQRYKLYESLLPVFRTMLPAERNARINELAIIFKSPQGRESHRALTYEELRIMHSSPNAIIAAHTHNHPSLGALSYEQQLLEIRTSKEILERQLGSEMDHFSYPFGTFADFNDDTLKVCRSLRFKMVAANYPALVHGNTPVFSFPRFLVRDWNAEVFESNLNSFFRG